MSHMESNFELALIAILACVIVYSLLTKSISRTVLTLPIIFMFVGLAASGQIEMLAPPEVLDETKRLLAEITLVLVLFADASHVRIKRLKENFQLPLRMLVIGMPITIALGTAVVYWINTEAGLAMALLTAAVLTPTDAALGQTVVTSPDVPQSLRQTINVESGLNDGLVLPFVLLGAVLAAAGMSEAQTDGLALMAVTQVVLGPVVGIAVGWGLARAMNSAHERDTISPSAHAVVFLTTAFAAFIAAEIVGGNGFIAAFVAGAAFGNTYRYDIHFISEFMESQGQLLTMAAFFVFGALMLPDGFAHMTWTAVSVALLFLTVVRMGPIWLSLLGTGLALREKLFLGWFGPRGLASILFALIMIDEFELPNEQELLACVSMTVFLSIILHGVSATPLARRIGRSTAGS